MTRFWHSIWALDDIQGEYTPSRSSLGKSTSLLAEVKPKCKDLCSGRARLGMLRTDGSDECLCEMDFGRLELKRQDVNPPQKAAPVVTSTTDPSMITADPSPVVTDISSETPDPLQSDCGYRIRDRCTVSSTPTSVPGAPPSATDPLSAVPITTTVSSASAVETTSEPEASSSGGGSGGLSQSAKIGLGVGLGVGILALIALVAALYFCCKRRRNHNAAGGKYVPQPSEPSMLEASRAVPVSQPRKREPGHYEPQAQEYEVTQSREIEPHHYGSQIQQSEASEPHGMGLQDYQPQVHEYEMQYQAYPPPTNDDVYQTPMSMLAPSEPYFPPIREGPESLPVLTIPGPDATPQSSREVSPERAVSPVSPVSAMSPTSSRLPSPRPHG